MSEKIRVKVGQEFVVPLEGTPTAGYIWDLVHPEETDKLIAPLGGEMKPDTSKIGAPARQVFHFRALKHGTTNLRFQYGRPWEGNPKQERIVSVQID